MNKLRITNCAFNGLVPLVRNHINSNASWTVGDDTRGCLFETFGPELEFVRQQNPRRVWTLIEQDGRQSLQSGIHVVNRIGYLVSVIVLPPGYEVEVTLDFTPEEERDDECLELD